MEEIYQTYKESVNFLWVYSNEAHADSLNVWKQIEGYDNHPNSETKSMEERAQRAKWMKTDPDPDLDMPMIIDYLNSDMGEDNAMRKAYGGGSPYSGYIIDCDGKILEAHAWAWADMTQSWPMSVDSYENLIKSLDKYLENPPPCFKGEAEVSKKSGGVFDKKEVSDVPEAEVEYVSGPGPQLDKEHIGWKKDNCSDCHANPIKGHMATELEQCVACHGNNGLTIR